MAVYIDSLSKIEKKLRIEDNGPAQSFMTNTCYKHMDKYVPRRAGTQGGTLRETVDIQPSYITYQTPYAYYQYRGYTSGPVRNYSTPGTGHHWDKRMISAEMKDVVKEVQDYIRR